MRGGGRDRWATSAVVGRRDDRLRLMSKRLYEGVRGVQGRNGCVTRRALLSSAFSRAWVTRARPTLQVRCDG